MKIPALVGNKEGISIWTDVDIPMIKGRNGSLASANQDALYWQLAINQPNEDAPVGHIENGGDMHVPRIIAVMSGRTELTVGTGEVRRFGTGEIFFVYGLGGHIATAMKPWPRTTLSITMPGQGTFR